MESRIRHPQHVRSAGHLAARGAAECHLLGPGHGQDDGGQSADPYVHVSRDEEEQPGAELHDQCVWRQRDLHDPQRECGRGGEVLNVRCVRAPGVIMRSYM